MGRAQERLKLRYELNAFLSAARSVTFLLQKEFFRVPGFASWWDEQRNRLSADTSAAFFLKLRNFSQKEGRISIVGGLIGDRDNQRWLFYFAGNEDPVPDSLLNRNRRMLPRARSQTGCHRIGARGH